jgi:hypothetical protein
MIEATQAGPLNGSLTIIVLTPLTTFSPPRARARRRAPSAQINGFAGVFPSSGRVQPPAPTDIDRSDFTGHIDGRLDVTHDLRLASHVRLRVATDYPGSPNIQARRGWRAIRLCGAW